MYKRKSGIRANNEGVPWNDNAEDDTLPDDDKGAGRECEVRKGDT